MSDRRPEMAPATTGAGREAGDRLNTIVLLCVSIPSFMINLDANIVAISLSTIAHELKADFAAIEWVISAYTLAFASLVLPAGALADRFGRKRILIVGLLVFTLASFLCGAASSVGMLNAARALQGVGAAMQLSAALATLSHTFRGPARARAFAFWGSVIGIAIALGPVVGGLITQVFGWAWAFYINVPIGLVMIALTVHAVEDSRDPDATTFDGLGFVSFSTFLFLTTLALISGNHRGWTSRPILIEALGAAAALAAFVWVETVQARPMLDFRVFRRPTYLGASIAAIAFAATLLTMLTYLPIYLQSALAYRPQIAGLLMLPMAIPLFIVPRLVAVHLTHRMSGRALLTVGLMLIAAGLLWLAAAAPAFEYRALLPGMVLAGLGAGILNGEVAKVGMTVIPPERAGMASGIGGTLRFSGLVLGFAALGAILYDRVAATIAAGLPPDRVVEAAAFAQSIAAGNVSGIVAGRPGADLHALALQGFGAGYRSILLTAALLAALAAVATWSLVRAGDTAPVARRSI